jgi:KDO2-lipid IV(A) lauroyltransferase
VTEPATAPAGAVGPIARRLRVGLLDAVIWLACRLPEPVIGALAISVGELWYRLTPRRAAQARLNLERVVGHLDATGMGSPRDRAAARDPVALERLVRSAFRQAVRYYLDMIRVGVGARLLPGRLEVETPEVVERALATGGSAVLVGLHFGALEIPTLYLAQRSGREIVVPMETLRDPVLQDWVVRTRSQAGVRIVGLEAARRELNAAIERGLIIGIVGDRDLSAGGMAVALFGAPARLPVGPALFAVEAGLPVYVGAVRRDAHGRWIGRLIEVEVPTEGSRRSRIETMLSRVAVAFEELVAIAPDQWWTLFFPIWDDLVAATPAAHGDRGRRGAGRGGEA